MNYETVNIKNKDSMDYAALHLFLFDDSPEIPIKTRPIVIICPGGGYEMTSDREADIIAVQYLSMGYHAAVLRYSVAPAVYPTALLELGRAVAVIRENAEKWHVDKDKIVVSGFSAGGHLAANYAMFWDREFLAEALTENMDVAKTVSTGDLQPDALILCYPVITSGEFAHEGSFRNLLGKDYEAGKEELSLECCVGDQVPRTFIWHTYEDDCVPVQNTLLLANALVQHHIPTEIHIFEKGGHGLSLGTRLTGSADGGWTQSEVAVWPQLVHTWMESWVTED